MAPRSSTPSIVVDGTSTNIPEAQISRPPSGGFKMSAYKAGALPGRAADFQRKLLEQQEIVSTQGKDAGCSSSEKQPAFVNKDQSSVEIVHQPMHESPGEQQPSVSPSPQPSKPPKKRKNHRGGRVEKDKLSNRLFNHSNRQTCTHCANEPCAWSCHKCDRTLPRGKWSELGLGAEDEEDSLFGRMRAIVRLQQEAGPPGEEGRMEYYGADQQDECYETMRLVARAWFTVRAELASGSSSCGKGRRWPFPNFRWAGIDLAAEDKENSLMGVLKTMHEVGFFDFTGSEKGVRELITIGEEVGSAWREVSAALGPLVDPAALPEVRMPLSADAPMPIPPMDNTELITDSPEVEADNKQSKKEKCKARKHEARRKRAGTRGGVRPGYYEEPSEVSPQKALTCQEAQDMGISETQSALPHQNQDMIANEAPTHTPPEVQEDIAVSGTPLAITQEIREDIVVDEASPVADRTTASTGGTGDISSPTSRVDFDMAENFTNLDIGWEMLESVLDSKDASPEANLTTENLEVENPDDSDEEVIVFKPRGRRRNS